MTSLEVPVAGSIGRIAPKRRAVTPHRPRGKAPNVNQAVAAFAPRSG